MNLLFFKFGSVLLLGIHRGFNLPKRLQELCLASADIKSLVLCTIPRQFKRPYRHLDKKKIGKEISIEAAMHKYKPVIF